MKEFQNLQISIMGSGNTAYRLGGLFVKAGLELKNLYARNESGRKLANKLNCAFVSLNEVDEIEAEVLFLMVSDTAIAQIQKEKNIKAEYIIHCSGSVSLEVLLGVNAGVFYPIQTLSKERELSPKQIPIAIEASNDKTLSLLKYLVEKVGFNSHYYNSEERLKLHLAAVIVNNFSNHLWQLADEYLEDNKLKANILSALLTETLEKQFLLGALQAQTGPAKRHDEETIQKHLDMLDGDMRQLYQLFSESIKKTYSK